MTRRIEKKKRRGQRDMSLPYKEHRYEVGAPDHGRRLDSFLAERVPWRSRAGIQKLIAEGRVEVLQHKDPQAAPVGSLRDGLRLRLGQEVVLRTPEPGSDQHEVPDRSPEKDEGAAACGIAEQQPALQLLYQDDQVLAVDKPPHVSVHPSKGHLSGSLIHQIHEWQRRQQPPPEEVATLCHRLDRETSGVLLCAKDQLSRTRLGRQFEARTVRKTYLAVVVGEVADEEGEIDLPIGPALTAEVRLRMTVRHDASGLPSCTRWRVAQRAPGLSLVELEPHTGRQHQLRVHLAAIGHPILGDKLYLGGDEVFLRHVQGRLTAADRDRLGLDRQALHAWKLEFEHPFTGRRLVIEAPLAADMAAALARA